LFGTPAGELLFPLISTPKGHVALYNYAEDNISKRERATKFLAVYFDEGGIVRDFESTNATNPLPMPAPTATTVVPIVIPRGK
jgi:hypothetical protein